MVRRQIGVAAYKCIEGAASSRFQALQDVSGRASSSLIVVPASYNAFVQQRRIVLPAQEESYDTDPATDFSTPALKTHVDRVGAVSVISDDEGPVSEGRYQNRDGYRFEDGRYAAFTKEISAFIPEARQFTDAVRTFAYGTDASFYRLNPKMVVKVHSEEEVARIIPIAAKHQVPITFRAAGTSLSGQAITDSVLLKLSHTGKNFRSFHIPGDGSEITVQPGLIGGEVNKILAAHHKKGKHPIQYKIGPDPSSIDSCMVGGMVSNNSSGMCCGVSQNTYHTLKDMRVVFVDGTVLDTADPASRESFMKTHKDLVDGVVKLAKEVQSDRTLANLIRRKFAIKCTTGYSLNALVDFHTDDPIEMIKRLIIGSEGTFGFVSQATYNTVPEWPDKASAFVLFPDVHTACKAASVLRTETSVDAVEIFDRPALKQCESHSRMQELVPGISGKLDPTAAGLLIECRARSAKALDGRIRQISQALKLAKLPIGPTKAELKELKDYAFHKDPKDYNVYWDVRKGLIPIVGAARETGTSMLIEDVACPVDKLADMTVDLGDMFQRYGYKEASCFGHALEGNLHLVFSQGFRTDEEVQRFGQLMDEMCYLVATKHSGSLKGEHGTGRNVAPYVEMEWGTKAYNIMWRLKELFDPDYVLNPGVVLNKDPMAHLKFLKPSPEANPLVDRCIECGFCESNCPSKDLTLTPRQRITLWREINRLRSYDSRTPEQEERLKELEGGYTYQGEQTCAADGMCQVKCPVGINTGELIKSIRADQLDSASKSAGYGISQRLANNFGAVNYSVPKLLNVVDFAHRLVGPKPLEFLSGMMNKASGNYIPEWNKYMPKGASKLNMNPPVPAPSKGLKRQVVYAPACVTRMMGPAYGDTEQQSVHEKLLSLFEKAGYEVIYPKGLKNSCCGMMFNSRGFKEAAKGKAAELEDSLVEASQNGKLPIVMDTSPCLAQLKGSLSTSALKFSLYEPIEFIKTHLKDKLEWSQVRDSVAIHVPCSSKKLGISDAFAEVAGLCAKEVTPSNIPCCGMAGDRGMRYPELTASSLQHLNLPSSCTDGYSSSRTCEMSMSNHSGIHFRGLVYLVDEATKPKQQSASA